MKIKVMFQGILSDWMGVPEAEFHLPVGARLGDVVSEIKQRFSPVMPVQLCKKDPEEFLRALWATTAGKRLTEISGPLEDGQEVKFFFMIAGG